MNDDWLRTGLTLLAFGAAWAADPPSKEPGLLFHLSGDRGLTADYAAGGDAAPNFANRDVTVVPGGPYGPYIQCGDHEELSYWAAGNIYAQRGTLSFFWRSRDPVGRTEFPVFRVGYADHSSWDMVWLRIDYNGKPGFDAFVTDVNLGRTRVSYAMEASPRPEQWVHLALAWDETRGMRFYVNGRPVGEAAATGRFDAALDQFGPHARIIAPTQVQSAFNFDRGADIDEIRIYDRMLSDNNIASLARGDIPQVIPKLARDLNERAVRDEWWFRYGWNRAGDAPPPLPATATTVRKVEIHDVYDLKRWWWRATDGIRETTWPGVYNRSRLPGRNDYFQLPDWDCYSLSGKTITFFLPDEPWNHVEISGGAWGAMTLLGQKTERLLFERPVAQERTFHRLNQPVTGQKIRFANVEQETPIGELSTYYVHPRDPPAGTARLTYRLTGKVEADNPSLRELTGHIDGRYPVDERRIMVALPAGAPTTARKTAQTGLPLVHILVPADFREVRNTRFSYTWENMSAGLDGVVLELPPLAVKPTHGEYVALNIQVKDPLWPLRNMLDFSFSVKPGEAHTLWLDTRDRILPNGKSLYLTIAASGADFGPDSLEGAELRLIFKPRAEAVREHELDRFTQVRDNYANLVEEHTNTKRLRSFARFAADLGDLLRVNLDHIPGRNYWHDANPEQPGPPFTQPTPPEGVPLWAFRQVEDLGYLGRFVNWYIDHRQIENGELGGGLSDDGDLTNWWPGTALMGVTPDKIRTSLLKEMDAFYDQHMFTNGLSTIQTDELHSYEEGIQALGQSLTLDYGSPKQLERAMETARRMEWLTGINAAGHRHIRSSYFNGVKMAEEGVWGWSRPSSYLVLHPALALVQFNGSPQIRKLILELADGLLAHRKPGRNGKLSIYSTIRFSTDEDIDSGVDRSSSILWAAWRWSGERKYLQPFLDDGAASLRWLNANLLDLLGVRETWGRQLAALTDSAGLHFAWQMGGDTRFLEQLYGAQIEAAAQREYINTEGSLWIDRVMIANAELQRARLGGIALVRNAIYTGHVVSWKFDSSADGQSVAILVPESTTEHVKILGFNLTTSRVLARMTGWDIEPGQWQMTQAGVTRTVEWERSSDIEVTFKPRVLTTIELKRTVAGTPYWSRPDLGITADDVRVEGNRVRVRVHSLGAVDAPASRVVVRDRAGRALATAEVPPLKAPLDLMPKTAEVNLSLPSNTAGSVSVEMSGTLPEITLKNNRVEVRIP